MPHAVLFSLVVAVCLPPIAIRAATPVPLQTTEVAPARLEERGNILFADFGKDAYGSLKIEFPSGPRAAELKVRLGEKLAADGAIDRKPPGSVNYRELSLTTQPGQRTYRLQIPSKEQHQNDRAVHTPPEIGEVTPFRYAEIEIGEGTAPAEPFVPLSDSVALDKRSAATPVRKANGLGRNLPLPSGLKQLAVHAPFDDNASSFESSDPTLNAIWALCKQTMKATTAFGIYIDGERERTPYEADAYINLLSHYACDLDPRVARNTLDYLLAHPTWPTEWSLHVPMIAAADYRATGNAKFAADHYEALKKKLLMGKARADGLLKALAIVDWPQAERDGYNDGRPSPRDNRQIGPEVNTVVNAFYYHSLREMAVLARALQKAPDADEFESKAKQVYDSFNRVFFDPTRGIYIDGEGSAHASLHANMFPLAFGLVPEDRKAKVADFAVSRGMACSAYGAQYLLEGLFEAGRDQAALQLMNAHTERSWWHMIELGSTMTLEAWGAKVKKNLTWNHAWGAAPANIIARYVLGVRPAEPGYKRILIAPQLGDLKWARGKVPTAAGAVTVSVENASPYKVQLELPPAASAKLVIPCSGTGQVLMDGKAASAQSLENVGPGRHVIELKR